MDDSAARNLPIREYDKLGKVLRKIRRKIYELLKLSLDYCKYALSGNKRVRIERSVWLTQYRRQLGRKASVHTTEYATENNKRLAAEIVPDDNAYTFRFPDGAVLQLPDVPNARNVAVNDLREILVGRNLRI